MFGFRILLAGSADLIAVHWPGKVAMMVALQPLRSTIYASATS